MKSKVLFVSLITVLSTCMSVAVANTSETSASTVTYTRQPTKEQLLASLSRLRLNENPDKEIQQFLQETLRTLYGVEYDPSKEISEETKVFRNMQDNAKSSTATGKDLWYYSLIIREPRVREQLKPELSQSEADKLADELQAQAVTKGDLSALTKTGYDNIVKGIGEPVFSQEKIDGFYRAYHNVTIQNSEALQTGLQQLTTVLKSRCFVDYYPHLDYPFYHRPYYQETGDITMNYKYSAVGDRLTELSRKAVRDNPKLTTKLDVIALRVQTHCETSEYAYNLLAGHLTHQENTQTYINYSADLPKEQDWLQQQVYLAVLAELLDMPELGLVFAERVHKKQGKEARDAFNKDVKTLSDAYGQAFGDTVPKDKYMDKKGITGRTF